MSIPSRGALAALALLLASPSFAQDRSSAAASVERGRYLAVIGQCNDCHTAGYAENMGNVPESDWLLGDQLGYRGPWGTTYPSNLRISLSTMTEAQWVSFARNLQSRPPMPSFSLNRMTDEDLQSLYRFIRQLQPLGDPAPAYVPPGVVPSGPFVQFPEPPPES